MGSGHARPLRRLESRAGHQDVARPSRVPKLCSAVLGRCHKARKARRLETTETHFSPSLEAKTLTPRCRQGPGEMHAAPPSSGPGGGCPACPSVRPAVSRRARCSKHATATLRDSQPAKAMLWCSPEEKTDEEPGGFIHPGSCG